MKIDMRAPISTLVAILSGVSVLFAYIFGFTGFRSSILDWVIVATAAALLIGVINLVMVHFDKIRDGKYSLYSIALIFSLAVTFSITLFEGSQGAFAQWIIQYVQIPIETSMMAVMTVTLAYAVVTLLNRRPTLNSIVFVIFTILSLMGAAPFLGLHIPVLNNAINWFTQVLASAGARGILLGVALGTITTGLRILIGSDRPFGG
jgi:hypothetical protein